ncbi:MAG: hypothetical protein ACKOXF_04210 [Chitinophagaceae bacterium]
MKPTNKTIVLIALLIPMMLSAQNTEIQYPNAQEFHTYLMSRSTKLQQKLYNQCNEGLYNLYKTDSLKARYDATTFKERGASSNATSDALIPLKAEEITGMWFTKTYSSPINTAEENDKLFGLALMFQPVLGGYLMNEMPLVWLSFEELKAKLPAEDFQFLVYLAKFESASNCYKIWEDDDLPYFDLFERKFSFLKGDSFTMTHMSRMLESGQRYIDLIRYNLPGLPEAEHFLVYDEQSKRQISLNDVGNTYRQKLVVFLSTDENDPTKGYDTSYLDPQYIQKVDKVVYDLNGKIIHMRSQITADGFTVANFTIPRLVYQSYDPGKHMLWYLEDYYKWFKQQPAKKKK